MKDTAAGRDGFGAPQAPRNGELPSATPLAAPGDDPSGLVPCGCVAPHAPEEAVLAMLLTGGPAAGREGRGGLATESDITPTVTMRANAGPVCCGRVAACCGDASRDKVDNGGSKKSVGGGAATITELRNSESSAI